MAYEVILAHPSTDTPPKRPGSPPKTSLSAEDIEAKLKAAEERRQVSSNCITELCILSTVFPHLWSPALNFIATLSNPLSNRDLAFIVKPVV